MDIEHNETFTYCDSIPFIFNVSSSRMIITSVIHLGLILLSQEYSIFHLNWFIRCIRLLNISFTSLSDQVSAQFLLAVLSDEEEVFSESG